MKEKICVAGIGAIGGLVAAMLGSKYGGSLSLIARGERAKALREKGVVLHSDFYGEHRASPAQVAASGEELGVQDYVFVCVKNYSLDQIIPQIAPCVGRETVVVPIMNGVEAGDRLRAAFPDALACDGLIYTITGANPDFSVTQKGSYTHLFLGSKVREENRVAGARRAWELLKGSGLDARWSEDIESEIWQKFILNCAFNTVTARYLADSARLRADEGLRRDLWDLLSEAYQVGLAQGVSLPKDLVETKFHFMMEKQPPDATSSMRRDVEAGRPTEYDAFTGAILRKAKVFHIPVPVTERYHRELAQL